MLLILSLSLSYAQKTELYTADNAAVGSDVAECAKELYYASKQLGDRLHLPHGRAARRVAMVERPCPRDGGESRGWLREETPTTEDEETEIVTCLLYTSPSPRD